MSDITSILDLSDEEIMNLDPATLGTAAPAASAAETGEQDADKQAVDPAATQPEEVTTTTPADATGDNGDEDDDQATAPDAPNGAEAVQGSDEQKAGSKAAPAPGAKAEPGADVAGAAKDPKAAPAAGKPADPTPAAPTAGSVEELKSFFDKITAPFKANGRDMQVRNADEAIALMQKGVGFHKRMEQLKPNLAIVESLRKADLLDQNKIDFLIDVMAGKPEAISKLVQDSKIDPLDLSAEKAGGYKPTSHKVSDSVHALDEVLAELEGSEGFDRTVDVVGNKWDKASRDIISDQPQLLHVITAHMQNGVYDQVAKEVERERVLGRLTGLSDLEAYRQVGDAMAAAGKFKPLEKPAGQPAPQGQGTPAVPAVVKPDPKQADDSNRNDRKRAASPARAATPTAQKVVGNPLAMSDEEIMKLG